MAKKRYSVVARVSTDNPAAVRPALERLLVPGSVTATQDGGEFLVRVELEGDSARDLNRDLLSSLRRVERKTRLRAEYTANGDVEKFFDYVSKGKRRV